MPMISKLASRVYRSMTGQHVLPEWFHLVHKLTHVAYYGAVVFGYAWVHEKAVIAVFVMEVAAVALGRDELRDAVVEFE